MDKVNYIIVNNEMRGALPFIHEHIKKQKRVNFEYALCSFLTAACLLAMDKLIRRQNERIEELSNEVKELKQMRGE